MKQIMLTNRGWWYCKITSTGLVGWYGPYRYRWIAVLGSWLCRR